MNKMILDGNFDPISDLVYIDIDELGITLLTDGEQDGIYEGIITEGLIVNSTYTYQFRINEDHYEMITREVTAYEGLITIDAWWNDDIPPLVTFVIDMVYQWLLGNFNADDFVTVAGTMNDWEGSVPMEHIGYYLYSITLITDPGVVEYIFRINGDVAASEDLGPGVNRMTWAMPGEPVSRYHFFNDYNWNTWPVTFEVDMNAEINAGNFDPENDYLDIAGSMNGWEGHDVLFDRDWTGEGIYTINMLIDMYNPYIEFKFRINGNWETSEFPVGGPNRFWMVQDTTGGVENLFECVYNVTDVPYPPYVYNLFIDGDLLIGEEISGIYTYFDPNSDPEGESLYQWYRYPESGEVTIIYGAIDQNYIITEEDYGNYLIFEVTPVATSDEPLYGYPGYAYSGQVGAAFINETVMEDIQICPNPVFNYLHITSLIGIERVEIFDLSGKLLYSVNNSNSNELNISLSNLKSGIYIVKCLNHSGDCKVNKFIKI
jgi:hypothetical protein